MSNDTIFWEVINSKSLNLDHSRKLIEIHSDKKEKRSEKLWERTDKRERGKEKERRRRWWRGEIKEKWPCPLFWVRNTYNSGP